jgi:hypothetical protein
MARTRKSSIDEICGNAPSGVRPLYWILSSLTFGFDSDAQRPAFAALVRASIESCSSQDFHPSLREEDSDSWLNIDETEFANLVSGTQRDESVRGEEQHDSEELATQKNVSKLKDLADRVHAFVDGEGSLEGALLQE